MTRLLLVLLPLACAVTYLHEQDYLAEDFFDQFDFMEIPDPTHGTVNYVSRDVGEARQLVRSSANGVFIGVDTENVSEGTEGRASIRLESTRRYNSGLFVISLDHAPTGCGSWPAFWMFGEEEGHTWPEWGEFDIIEWIHEEDNVSTTLHTSAGCNQGHLMEGLDMKAWWNPGIYGQGKASNCDVHAPGQWQNQGCSQRGHTGTIGPSFNEAGGGTYAAEWDPVAEHMRVWFWVKGTEPADLKASQPDPDLWGQPNFHFDLDERCDKTHFKNMKLTFDITFCGDLGSPTFAEHCGHTGMTCEDFVRSQPGAFNQTHWQVTALDVYQRADVSEAAKAVEELQTASSTSACRQEHVTSLETRVKELEAILAERDGELRAVWGQLAEEEKRLFRAGADLKPPGHGRSPASTDAADQRVTH